MRIQQKPAIHEAMNPRGGNRPSAADQIRRQIELLQKELEKVEESKDSPEVKNGKIKELNEQIQQLQKNLQQAAIDEKRQEMDEAAAKAAEKAQQEAAKYQDEEQLQAVPQPVNLFAVNSKFAEMKTLRHVQVDMIARKDFTGAANIAGRIMSKSMEIQETLKRGSEIRPEQVRQERDQTSAGESAEVQQQEILEAGQMTGSGPENGSRRNEKQDTVSFDIRV